MEGGVFYEHGHRMIAGIVGVMTFVLGAWLWVSEKRRWICWLGTAAVVAVAAQALLGGLTVLMRLPPQVSIAHAVLAQTFFCLTIAMAFFMNNDSIAFSFKTNAQGVLPLSITAILYVQLILGAGLRHIGSSVFLVSHISTASLVTVLSFIFLFKSRRPLALAMVLLICMQIGLGLLSVFPAFVPLDLSWSVRTAVITSHVAVGALLLAASLYSTLQCMVTK